MADKPFFPVFLDLSDKKIIAAGAGAPAREMIRMLTLFAGDITVIASAADGEDAEGLEQLSDLEKDGRIRILRKTFEREDIFDADLVIADGENEKEAGDIYAACRCLGIAVYVCGSRTKQDFIIPEIARRGALTAGICHDRRDAAAEKELARRILNMPETE